MQVVIMPQPNTVSPISWTGSPTDSNRHSIHTDSVKDALRASFAGSGVKHVSAFGTWRATHLPARVADR